MTTNSINIIIAIIQIIIMFALGYWQISVAKSIARNEIGNKINFKTKLRNFISKNSSTIIKFVILYNIFIMALFVFSPKGVTRIEILYLVYVTASTVVVCILTFYLLLLGLIKESHNTLYCMICRRSDEIKPICI